MPKTPDEIKKGLNCSLTEVCAGNTCPYWEDHDLCIRHSRADAVALIKQLTEEGEAAIRRANVLMERVQQLEAERDSLLKYLTESHFVPCDICKHDVDGSGVMGCKRVREIKGPCFEWRGVQKEE